ncbi:MAG: site-specific DNA-methyltransferase [Bacilli bacterium]
MDYEIEQLLKQIKELETDLNTSKKYGLVWDKENTKEDVVLRCENDIPVLCIDDTKTIKNGSLNTILIEGDNYHSLTALNYVQKQSIDLIYIDPPYNTGNEDFTYNDKFVNLDDGYRHSKWLSFMQKRLSLARDLLKDNGVIFISIDDREQAQLKLLCDSIFGENKHLATIHWRKNRKPHNAGGTMSISCEYILVYFKKEPRKLVQEYAEMFSDEKGSYAIYPILKADKKIRTYTFPKGLNCEGVFHQGRTKTAKNDKCNVDILDEPIIKNGVLENDIRVSGRFCLTDERGKLSEAFLENNIYFTKGGIPKEKRYREEDDSKIDTNYWDIEKGKNEDGNEELTTLFNISQDNELFSHPKPVNLIKKILRCINQKDAVVLDFFAGSGTTGQAVIELNEEDNGTRRCILCTNNETSIKAQIKYFVSKGMIPEQPKKGTKQETEWKEKWKEFVNSDVYKRETLTEAFQEIGICKSVTYPRLKTVITGKRHDGTTYSEGTQANLYYLKTDFVKDEQNTEQAKYNLVEKVDALLCISENIFDEVERNEYSSHYASKDRHLFIYNDYFNVIKFEEFKARVLAAEGEKIVYVYSSDNNVDETLIDDISVVLKPIPSKIYEIYKEIVEGIKRGE